MDDCLFSHIPTYSDRIRPLLGAISAINSKKKDIGQSVLTPIDKESSFILETVASSSTIAGTFSLNGKRVVFFSRVLTNAEKRHPIIENEALAIVECVQKWKPFLSGRHFHLMTDQRALSYEFDNHDNLCQSETSVLQTSRDMAQQSY